MSKQSARWGVCQLVCDPRDHNSSQIGPVGDLNSAFLFLSRFPPCKPFDSSQTNLKTIIIIDSSYSVQIFLQNRSPARRVGTNYLLCKHYFTPNSGINSDLFLAKSAFCFTCIHKRIQIFLSLWWWYFSFTLVTTSGPVTDIIQYPDPNTVVSLFIYNCKTVSRSNK